MWDAINVGRVESEKIMHHLHSCKDFRSICNISSIRLSSIIFFSINGTSDGIKKLFISISIIIHQADNSVISSTFIEIVEALCDSIFCNIKTFRFFERSRSGSLLWRRLRRNNLSRCRWCRRRWCHDCNSLPKSSNKSSRKSRN